MNLSIFHKHHRVLVVVYLLVAVLLTAAIGYGFLVEQERAEAIQSKLDLEINRQKADNLEALQEVATHSSSSQALFKSFVPAEDTLVDMIDLVELAGRSAGAQAVLVSVRPLEDGDNKNGKGWRLELRLEGSFAEVWQGLRRVELVPVTQTIGEVYLARLSPLESTGPVRFGAGIVMDILTIR